MANESSSHWKVGIAFVLACVAIGTLIAIVNMTDGLELEQDGIEEPEASSTNSWYPHERTAGSEDDLSYQDQSQEIDPSALKAIETGCGLWAAENENADNGAECIANELRQYGSERR